MPKNLITDPITQGEYFTEFASHVLRYKDQSRKGLFVRYYNIDRTLMNSTTTKSVLHNKDHIYNIYEYTPVWSVDEITDNTETNEAGRLKFQGVSSITTYSIPFPTVHDLVAFVYPPYTTTHVFRVKNLSTVLRERDAGLNLFKLELEFANDVDILDSLSIADRNVYSVFDGKNIPLKLYTDIMAERTVIQNTLDTVQSQFDNFYEFFGSGSADLFNNIQIYKWLTTNKSIEQYFTSKIPYGATSFVNAVPAITDGSVLTYATSTVSTGTATVSTVTNITDYTFNSTTVLADISSMFSKFQG